MPVCGITVRRLIIFVLLLRIWLKRWLDFYSPRLLGARAAGGLIFTPLFFALNVICSVCGLREKVAWLAGYLLYIAKNAAKNQATHCTLGMLDLLGKVRISIDQLL